MRCFVACWPDEATRASLDRVAQAQLARHPRARRVRRENLHLTLAFIGELPEAAALEAALALQREPYEAIDWRIDHVGRFEHSRVLWAGGPEEPRLLQLAQRVRDLLTAMRVPFDRKPFAAHITLLRDLPLQRRHDPVEAPEPIEPIVWPLRTALLMASESDAQGAIRYRAVERA